MIKPYTKQLSFKRILTECAREQENAYLSVIETETEHNFVSNLLSRHQLGKTKQYCSQYISLQLIFVFLSLKTVSGDLNWISPVS